MRPSGRSWTLDTSQIRVPRTHLIKCAVRRPEACCTAQWHHASDPCTGVTWSYPRAIDGQAQRRRAPSLQVDTGYACAAHGRQEPAAGRQAHAAGCGPSRRRPAKPVGDTAVSGSAWHQKEGVLSVLDGVDTFLCWPAGGGKTRLMRILAAMFPRCLSLVIRPLALAREQCHEVHEALGQQPTCSAARTSTTGTRPLGTLLGAPAAPPYRSAAHANPTYGCKAAASQQARAQWRCSEARSKDGNLLKDKRTPPWAGPKPHAAASLRPPGSHLVQVAGRHPELLSGRPGRDEGPAASG
eukprot:scaffold61190_cov71-Phaeocystis_antarctica.AAC.2